MDREAIRETVTLYALDFIRKYLMNHPKPLPGSVPLAKIEQNIRTAITNAMPTMRNRPGANAFCPPNSNLRMPVNAQAQQLAIEHIVNERRR